MARFTLELSPVELDVVWRSQPFDVLPLIFAVPSPGATSAERAELEARVWTDLVERDLADDHGRPTAEVVDALSVIDRRRRSLHLTTFGPDPVRAILAIRGPRAVLAILDERFRLAPVADTGLANTMLSLLPHVPAGRGHAVSIPAATFAATATAATPAAAWELLSNRGVNRDDARILLTMTTGSIRIGQIAVELRTPSGRLTRSRRIVAFYDTPDGRYQTRRKAIGSVEHLTVAPAARATLARSINELFTELRVLHEG